MFDARNRLSQTVKRELDLYFPNKLFKTIIPRSVRLAEAPSFGQTILEYAGNSKGAQAYYSLAQEVLAALPAAQPVPEVSPELINKFTV